MTPKSIKFTHWTFTLLLAIPMLGSGIAYVLALPPIARGMIHLGYPGYLMRLLGVAKILAVAAILTGASRQLKEWAYAGLTFVFLGAAYSHLSSGDGKEIVPCLVMLLFLGVSYLFWKRRSAPETT